MQYDLSTQDSRPLAPIAPNVDFTYQLTYRQQLFARYPQALQVKYFLAPELRALANLPTITQHQRMLFLLLWNTGARINEALAVCPNDIIELKDEHGHVQHTQIQLRTLKQQNVNRPGRAKKRAIRTVPLFDPDFVAELKRYTVTHCSNKKLPIFASKQKKHKGQPMSAETARQWFKEIEQANANSANPVPLYCPISPRVLRHSFAIHCLLHGIHPKRIQMYLGHARMESTEIYTRLLTLELDLDTIIRF